MIEVIRELINILSDSGGYAVITGVIIIILFYFLLTSLNIERSDREQKHKEVQDLLKILRSQIGNDIEERAKLELIQYKILHEMQDNNNLIKSCLYEAGYDVRTMADKKEDKKK